MKNGALFLLKTILLFSLLWPLTAEAIDMSLTGDWLDLSISENNLSSGPGSNLTEDYVSNVDQGTIDIVNTSTSSDAWRIDVKRTDTSWHSTAVLSVLRYDSGTGAGSISGGTSYQSVGTTALSFFSGAGDRVGVHIQLKISNVSISIPPGNYSTTITYTVVDI